MNGRVAALFSTLEPGERPILYGLEPLCKTSLFLAAGTVAAIFQSTLAYSLCAIGIALACGLIALKAYSFYNENSAMRFYMHIIAYDKQMPMVPVLMLIAVIAINLLCPPLAAALGACLGLCRAAILQGYQCLRLQGLEPPASGIVTMMPL
jgi:hypothetical protein